MENSNKSVKMYANFIRNKKKKPKLPNVNTILMLKKINSINRIEYT